MNSLYLHKFDFGKLLGHFLQNRQKCLGRTKYGRLKFFIFFEVEHEWERGNGAKNDHEWKFNLEIDT